MPYAGLRRVSAGFRVNGAFRGEGLRGRVLYGTQTVDVTEVCWLSFYLLYRT